MPAYKAYPKAKTTPSRRTRKSERNTTFRANSKLNKKAIDRKESTGGR